MLLYILVSFLALVSSLLIKKIAIFYNFSSQSDFRRNKVSSVPLLGGVAVWISWALVNLTFNLNQSYLVVLTSLPIVVVSCYEDKFKVKKLYKFLIEFFSIGLFFYFNKDSSSWFQQWGGLEWTGWFVHGLWVLFLMKIIKNIDAMDGLAASFACIASLGLYFLSNNLNLLILSGAYLGFLFLNWPRAKLYLGKSGGALVGFVIATQMSFSDSKNNILIIPLTFLILLYPQMNFFASLVKFKSLYLNDSSYDRDQFHLKLKRIGLGATKSLLLLIFVNIGLSCMAVIAYYQNNYLFSFLLLGLAVLSALMLISALRFIEKRITTQSAKLGADVLSELFKTSDSLFMPRFPKGILINFEVYYPLLIDSSVEELRSFFKDISYFLNQKIKVESCLVSSNILFVYNLTGPDQDMLSQQFKQLIVNHDIFKESISLPWGLSHIRDPQESRLFIKKFGSKFLYQTATEIKKVS